MFRAAWLAGCAVVAFPAPSEPGGARAVYLLDESIARDVDVSRYAASGEVFLLEGSTERVEVEAGPAPDPYPRIRILEPGFDRLGASASTADGLQFFHHGKHWMRNRIALVEWRIEIPNAGERSRDEFTNDVTLSLWVDWNQDGAWGRDEVMIRRDVDLAHRMPAQSETARYFYLTGFRVPDLPRANAKGPQRSEIRQLWVRATISYDDADASPDDDQLFGEVEDYRVGYRVVGNRP